MLIFLPYPNLDFQVNATYVLANPIWFPICSLSVVWAVSGVVFALDFAITLFIYLVER